MTVSAPRLDRIRDRLEQAELDALLVTNPYNRRYASGFTGSNGWLLIPADATTPAKLATDFRYLEQAAHESPHFEIVNMTGEMEQWWGELARPFGHCRLGFESSDVTVAAHKRLREVNVKLPASQRPALVQSDQIIEQVRAQKDESELSLLRRAVSLTDGAFAHAERAMQPGWTEQQVSWELEQHARSHGADGMAFESIVAAGAWGARPHARPRDEAILEGQPIVIDMGARFGGYCADMTRTIVLGDCDDTFPRIYEIVLAAHETAAQMVEPGMLAKDADQIARQVISDAGYGEQFGHGLGHGVGLQIHEKPYIGTMSKDTLEVGMVITIEPGIYLPEWGGVRIEDMGLLDEDGFHSFTSTPKARMLA
jgi:Xaa-Pro aminopeptidase